MNIRPEKATDQERIRQIHRKAFTSDEEANLVAAIRQRHGMDLSLVAEEDGELMGHILFSAVMVLTNEEMVRGTGLAPLAVCPDAQRRGIGSALVKRGMKILHDRGCPFVVLIGDPEYYHRFGFVAAEDYGLASEYENLPPGVFMVHVFDENKLPKGGGIVKYRPEFAALEE